MNTEYEAHVKERAEQGIPPLPLTAGQAEELVQRLETATADSGAELLGLLQDRIAPGVDPAAKVKAEWLNKVAVRETASAVVTPERAVELLGTMLGGYNVPYLVDLLDNIELSRVAAEALKKMVLVFDNFAKVKEKADRGNGVAKEVVKSWAEAEWFTSRDELPGKMTLKVFKVDGETNTDDFSPAKDAPTRPDIPLHALSMGGTRFPGGIEKLAEFRAEGHAVAFVGNTVGTGSSRKSATNSLIWHIGENIPFVPNKRRGGVVIGEAIAPIFFNTFEDSGGLPLRVDSVDKLNTGDIITIDTREGVIVSESGEVLAKFELSPVTMADEYRAGGRVPLIIGRKLIAQARESLGMGESDIFAQTPKKERKADQGYTLAQKMVGKACGVDGVLPGETCEPKTTTVGSQDTTGPMT
ncbi:MAG: aconitate hydratase B, partial [Planctomycetes bacterium]|nr:aconitate hydratase B [Planctomycetota bacterium]